MKTSQFAVTILAATIAAPAPRIPRPEEPEKPLNLLWALDEVVIALQQIRERLRRMAQQDGPPHKPRKTGKA